MSAPTLDRTDQDRYALGDAFHLLGDCATSDRIVEGPGLWHVSATDTAMAETIADAMTDVVILIDDDDQPVWSGWLLGQLLYVRVGASESFDPAEAVADLTPALVGGTP